MEGAFCRVWRVRVGALWPFLHCALGIERDHRGEGHSNRRSSQTAPIDLAALGHFPQRGKQRVRSASLGSATSPRGGSKEFGLPRWARPLRPEGEAKSSVCLVGLGHFARRGKQRVRSASLGSATCRGGAEFGLPSWARPPEGEVRSWVCLDAQPTVQLPCLWPVDAPEGRMNSLSLWERCRRGGAAGTEGGEGRVRARLTASLRLSSPDARSGEVGKANHPPQPPLTAWST